jgi:hypothetical protein
LIGRIVSGTIGLILIAFAVIRVAVVPFHPRPVGAAPGAQPRNALLIRREVTDAVVEHDDPLARVLAAWRGLRGEGKVPPPRRTLIPEDHLRPILGFAHVVECAADDPMDYVFRLFGSRVSLFGDVSLTRQRIADLPDGELAQQTASDYFNVINKGCPAFHKIKTRIGWRTASYTRLLLPLSDEARRVTQLLVCINPRQLPELGELPLW